MSIFIVYIRRLSMFVLRNNSPSMNQQPDDLPYLDFFVWTDEQLAKLSLAELLVLTFEGEVSLHPGGVFATQRLFQKLSVSPDDYVLEIGCGGAKDLCKLVENYDCRAIGVDFSDLMLKFAEHRVKAKGLGSKIRIIKGDVSKMNFFNDGQFDIVIAQSVLATMVDKDRASTEISRVLRSGGHFGDIEMIWINEPDYELVYNVEKRIGSFDRPLKSNEWAELFQEAGFKDPDIFVSSDFGFPTDIYSMIQHNGGFAESMKLLMLLTRRSYRIDLAKRTEHLRWMRNSGKMGYGIYVFEKI
jgi:ubiquinone/menaquinone biosynthesis C-methylase UbiE